MILYDRILNSCKQEQERELFIFTTIIISLLYLCVHKTNNFDWYSVGMQDGHENVY